MRAVLLTICAVATALGCKADSEPVPESQTEKTSGDTADARSRAFRPGPFSRSIREPKPGDWLAEHEEEGQTFEQWESAKKNIPNAKRRVIYLQPIGPFNGPRTVDLEQLRTFASTFFQLPVVVNPPLDVNQFPTREHPDFGWQIKTGDVLDALEARVPNNAYCVLGLTMTDLYPRESWNFVFGMASLSERVGVFSFARYSPQAKELSPSQRLLLTERAFKVLSHEAGHMFGIEHCTAHHCGMNGSNHLRETDDSPLYFCPVCLRKLQASVGFDVVERDAKLAEVLDEAGLERDAQWYRDRRAWLLKP